MLPPSKSCLSAEAYVLQAKYKHSAEQDRASYTTVIDTPDIIHAQQIRNIVSQVMADSQSRYMWYLGITEHKQK